MVRKVLVSFGDLRLRKASERFSNQAASLNFFSEVIVLNETSVKYPFPEPIQSKLNPNVRGFGYWVWKPVVLLQVLGHLNEGDLVLYADVGCHLNPKGLARLDEYFRILANDPKGVVSFQNKPPKGPLYWDGRLLPFFPDAAWTKGDLLDFFQVRNRFDLIETGTVGAGVILLRKCGFADSLIGQWAETMMSHWNLVDDSESITPNHPWFIEHRHDQSFFHY